MQQFALYEPTINPRIVTKAIKNIIEKPIVAILELIANSWDAGATRVEINWPTSDSIKFSIDDNGHGMTLSDFKENWLEVGYNRLIKQGSSVTIQKKNKTLQRKTFGKNGVGKFAIFCFADKFKIETCASGEMTECTISKNIATNLFDVSNVQTRPSNKKGTTITALESNKIKISEDFIITEIAQRFVFDSDFEVFINGKKVTSSDISEKYIQKHTIPIDSTNSVDITIISRCGSDSTLRFSGIGWRVHGRLVGEPTWSLLEIDRLLDGRTAQARRHAIIIDASFLADAVNEDWTGFDTNSSLYIRTSEAVAEFVAKFISSMAKDTREQKIQNIKNKTEKNLKILGEISRTKVESFINDVVQKCPSIKDRDMENIVKSLAAIEESNKKYSIVEKLAELSGAEWDKLHEIITDWTINMAKEALDEIKGRLQLIDELRKKTEDITTLEVQELQPIMEKCLWIFGPEFESIEYASNQTIAACFQKFMSKKIQIKTSLNRPDFTILPDAAVSFHSTPSYGEDHAEDGLGNLVILELKAPSVALGRDEKSQPGKYIDEFLSIGLITERTRVTAFVIGSKTQKPLQMDPLKEGNSITHIMLFPTLLQRAESRLFNLRKKLCDAPCLQKPILKPQIHTVKDKLPSSGNKKNEQMHAEASHG